MLATLLAKPDKGMDMHGSIFATNSGQTRKLRSYLPDDHDISGKVRTVSTLSSACTAQPCMCLLGCPVAHSSHAVLGRGRIQHLQLAEHGSEAVVLHERPRCRACCILKGLIASLCASHSKSERRQYTYLRLLWCLQLGVAASLILTKPAYAPDSTHDILSKPAYAPDTLKDTLGWKASSPDSHSRRLRSYLPDDHDISGKVRTVSSSSSARPAQPSHVLVRWDAPAAPPCQAVLSIVSTL